MAYTLDVSVALFWVIFRRLTPKALRLGDEYRRQLHELIAPAHFPVEVASALTKAARQKLIPAGDARPLIQDVLALARGGWPRRLRIDPSKRATGPQSARRFQVEEDDVRRVADGRVLAGEGEAA